MPLFRPPDPAAKTRRQRWLPTPRGWALLMFGGTTLGRGLLYLLDQPPASPALELVTSNYPRTIYGSAWVLAGLLCLGSVVARRWRLALGLVAGLYSAWALSAGIVWIAANVQGAGSAALLYLALASSAACISVMHDPPVRTK